MGLVSLGTWGRNETSFGNTGAPWITGDSLGRDRTHPCLETNLKIIPVLSSKALSLPVGVSSPQKFCCPSLHPLSFSLSIFLPNSDSICLSSLFLSCLSSHFFLLLVFL